jgi:predicted metal-dependent hydrolase
VLEKNGKLKIINRTLNQILKMELKKRELNIGKEKIFYSVKRKRGIKNIWLSIDRKGELTAVSPFLCRTKFIENLIKNKSAWIFKKISQNKKRGVSLLQRGNKRRYLENKEKALVIATEKLKYFNKFYRFRYKKVSIRNQHSRWGSCSSKKNLNFNWRIVYLPQEYLDYLIVHELCHLKELNHSARFWNLVAKQIPNYKIIRRKMINL